MDNEIFVELTMNKANVRISECSNNLLQEWTVGGISFYTPPKSLNAAYCPLSMICLTAGVLKC